MNLNKNIDLENASLISFINLNDEEAEMVRQWRNHDEIKKWMYQDHIISPEEHARFINGLKEDGRNFYWLAKNKQREAIGVISLNRVDFKNGNAYLGIYSNPYRKYPNAGRLLIQCLKTIAFDIAKIHTLKLEFIETNQRIINFYRRMGFNDEGRLKEFVFKEGKRHDVIVMGIVNKGGT